MGTPSEEPAAAICLVYVTKDERDGLRKYAKEMQDILADLKDSYTVPVDTRAYGSLCVRAAQSLMHQERDGLIRQPPKPQSKENPTP